MRKRTSPHLEHQQRRTLHHLRHKGECGSGKISVNGSAARRASVSDLLIIASFAQMHEGQVAKRELLQIVFVDEKNQQVGLRHNVPTQA